MFMIQAAPETEAKESPSSKSAWPKSEFCQGQPGPLSEILSQSKVRKGELQTHLSGRALT